MVVGLVIWFAWVGRRRAKEAERFRHHDEGGEVGWRFWKRWRA
jgi:hypothetical protein